MDPVNTHGHMGDPRVNKNIASAEMLAGQKGESKPGASCCTRTVQKGWAEGMLAANAAEGRRDRLRAC